MPSQRRKSVNQASVSLFYRDSTAASVSTSVKCVLFKNKGLKWTFEHLFFLLVNDLKQVNKIISNLTKNIFQKTK